MLVKVGVKKVVHSSSSTKTEQGGTCLQVCDAGVQAVNVGGKGGGCFGEKGIGEVDATERSSE